jgi:hypothetical protein
MQHQEACSVAVKRASQPSGVVPLLTCKGFMQTIVRLPVGIPQESLV